MTDMTMTDAFDNIVDRLGAALIDAAEMRRQRDEFKYGAQASEREAAERYAAERAALQKSIAGMMDERDSVERALAAHGLNWRGLVAEGEIPF